MVVNCAGRTRSIIGARVLQRMKLPNVVSLRNGTSGWLLAGLELERGADRVELPAPSPRGLRRRPRRYAARVVAEDGVQMLTVAELQKLMPRAADGDGLPGRRAHARGVRGRPHPRLLRGFPGGQAVQRADDTVAVRTGTSSSAATARARVTVTASWYRQMGFPNVYAVTGGTTAWKAAGQSLVAGTDEPDGAAGDRSARSACVRLRGRRWRPRWPPRGRPRALRRAERPVRRRPRSRRALAVARLARAPHRRRRAGAGAPLVVTDEDGHDAVLAAATLEELGYRDVAALAGGSEAWRKEGRPLEQGLTGVMRPPDDVVPAGPDRSYADMINYLRWEEKLGHKYGEAHS